MRVKTLADNLSQNLRLTRCLPAAICLLLPAVLVQAQHIVAEDPLTAEQQREKFHLPPGFEIQLVAAEPEIAKPINLNFDAQGRLYVTQSVEYPFAAKGRGRDAVMRLTVDPHTGAARKVEQFVDGLNIPIGLAPLSDGVLVFSIPNIYRCRDTTGNGQIDRRDVLFGQFGTVDTHGLNNGLTRWIDGWVYTCHGFRNQSSVKGNDGEQVSMTSGNTYRFRIDGSHVEQFTHGQVNPFGLTFDNLGNVYTADCHTKPAYALLRGGCYPSFGRPHDGLGFAPAMMDHNHGSTGIAGIVYYEAEHFPAKYRGTLFVGNPITRRVNHDRLERRGSTPRAVEEPDFISCDDKWFRPVDLQMGPDGALYIADFYNRIIGHYEVPLNHPGRDRHRGRIWRVVYKGEANKRIDPLAMPNLAAADMDELIARLSDENLTVRVLVTHELLDRFGKTALGPIRQMIGSAESDARARAHGLWILERLAALDSPTATQLAADPNRLVRVHLVKALAERGRWDDATRALVSARLADKDPFVRRAAADGLGRHPAQSAVVPLLDLWAQTPLDDAQLIHVVRMALRDHLLQPGLIAGLPDEVLGNEAYSLRLFDVALGARTSESAALVLRAIEAKSAGAGRLPEFVHHAVRYAADDQLTAALAAVEKFREGSPELQLSVLDAVRRGVSERGGRIPASFTSWASELGATLLRDEQNSRVAAGVNLARVWRLAPLYQQVSKLVDRDAAVGGELRKSAIDACLDIDADRAVPPVQAMLQDPTESVAIRQKAAEALARVNNPTARGALMTALAVAPESVALFIAGNLAKTRDGGEQLLAAISAGKASPRLLQDDRIKKPLLTLGITDAEQRVLALTAGLPPRDDAVQQLIRTRRSGYLAAKADPSVGQKVFVKACAACHRVGNEGKKIGPELDGIGHRGLDRVLEDVLDPSRNVDGAFRMTVIETAAGRVISGLLLRKQGQVLVLADAQGKEVRVAAGEIENQKRSPLSPMPANVPELVKQADFYHLMAFLLAQRQKVAGK